MRRTILLFTLCHATVCGICAQSPQIDLPAPVPETSRAWRTGLDALGAVTGPEEGCTERGGKLRAQGADLEAQQAVLERDRSALNKRLDELRMRSATLAAQQAEHSRAQVDFNASEAELTRRGKEVHGQLDAAAEAHARESAALMGAAADARSALEELQKRIAGFEAATDLIEVNLARYDAGCATGSARSGVTVWEGIDTPTLDRAYEGWSATLAEAYAGWQSGNFALVLQIVEPLAHEGNAAAQFVMGGLHARGQGVPQDDALAASWWQKAANQGLAGAQNELAVMLSDGRGVPEDAKQAVVWYRKAAEQGLAVAQANLALMYWRGLGVKRNDAEAVQWFRKAAGQQEGFGWAEYYLGVAYSTGRGVITNQREAARWFSTAAERGYSAAQYALGALHLSGAGVPRNQGRAAHWWALAAQDGYEPAETSLKSLLPQLPRRKMRGSTEILASPDADAAVVRTASDGETAYMLDRSGGWIEVYFSDSQTRGYLRDQER